MSKRKTDESIDAAPPTRTFTILQKTGFCDIDGHVPQVLPSGTLQILRYRNDIPWTVLMLPAGEWRSLQSEVPSPGDIAKLEAYNLRYGQKSQLMSGTTKGAKVN